MNEGQSKCFLLGSFTILLSVLAAAVVVPEYATRAARERQERWRRQLSRTADR